MIKCNTCAFESCCSISNSNLSYNCPTYAEKKKMRIDEQIEKGIECCVEFLCGECPYENIQGLPDHINLRCMNTLMKDIEKYIKELKTKGEEKCQK